ncbi:hypothetical protein QQ020_13075 [Fulvivirgaceae bacterium BMA12]|uniref:DUF2281 domain-containing protein n=1 Tax=Agaribacillus aureus TaxID=3051825 RepID=A0ABT8L5H4_9BACT|nr:hypothetical protein [Fulvivirgaceae bacterium BMA12]
MKRSDIHTKINELLNSIPEDSLKQVLEYLKEIQDKSSSKIEFSHNLNKILREDRNLLKRLAQ